MEDKNGSTEKSVRTFLENGFLRLTTVIVLVGAVATAAYQVAEFKNEVIRSLERMTQELGSVKRDVEDLNTRIVGKGPNGWHRKQQKTFCTIAEFKNEGWSCPDIDQIPE